MIGTSYVKLIMYFIFLAIFRILAVFSRVYKQPHGRLCSLPVGVPFRLGQRRTPNQEYREGIRTRVDILATPHTNITTVNTNHVKHIPHCYSKQKSGEGSLFVIGARQLKVTEMGGRAPKNVKS